MKCRSSIHNIDSRSRFRPSFGLKTLLIGVGVASVLTAYGVHWHQRRQAAETARPKFDVLHSLHGLGQVPHTYYFERSAALCITECSVPLTDRRSMCEEHLRRMDVVYFAGETTLFGGDGRREYYAAILPYKIEAETWVRAGRPLSDKEQAGSLSASAMVPDARRFDYIQLAVFGCLVCVGVERLAAKSTRRVKQFVVRQPSIARPAASRVTLFSLLIFHCALAVAYSWPLTVEWIPTWLSLHVVDTTQMKFVGANLLAAGVGVILLARRASFRGNRIAIPTALVLLTGGTTLLQGRVVFFLLAVAIFVALLWGNERDERIAVAGRGEMASVLDTPARTGQTGGLSGVN